MLNTIRFTIVKQTNKINTGTVYFFHGSGDTGQGVLDWIKHLVGEFTFPHIKFMFPTAPLRPYSPLKGEKSHVWFDRLEFGPHVSDHTETLNPMAQDISALIQNEVDGGIPINRIVVGGFSMGGSLALNVAYKFLPGTAGVFALSTYLNDSSQVYQNLQNSPVVASTPILMFHGERDNVVPIQWGRNTFDKLSELNVSGEFVTLKNTFHELKKREVVKLFEWIVTKIPN